ncbi:thioesterase II family protein [Kitasatospora sp. NPDC056138]|uniref:thioesterase II family protein n=1 Tax=Kitasatospora sp. NPDC056138 TaxID=3345724 RepID=UPI0035DF27A2
MDSPWLTSAATGRDPAAVRLFCFAHAGGGTAFFRPWRAALLPEVEVCPVRLPGRESRHLEPAYTRMNRLIEPLVAALRPYADRPFAVFGHSMGAAVAYEVARRFCTEPADGPLRRLLVSGRRAPHLAARRRPIAHAPQEEFLAAVRRLGGTPEEVLDQPDLVRLFLPGMRADFELNETYAPADGPRLSCPVSAFTGDRDPEVTPEEMGRWRETTDVAFRLRVFTGGHFYLSGPRAELVREIRSDLLQAVPR